MSVLVRGCVWVLGRHSLRRFTMSMEPTDGPPWQNSPLGRFFATLGGGVCIGGGIFSLFDSGTASALSRVASLALLSLFGAVAIGLAWTSRLYVEGGQLVAHHFYGDRSLPLDSVIKADAEAWTGIIIRTSDGKRMRTWVSVRHLNDLGYARARRVAKEIVAQADQYRSAHPASH